MYRKRSNFSIEMNYSTHSLFDKSVFCEWSKEISCYSVHVPLYLNYDPNDWCSTQSGLSNLSVFMYPGNQHLFLNLTDALIIFSFWKFNWLEIDQSLLFFVLCQCTLNVQLSHYKQAFTSSEGYTFCTELFIWICCFLVERKKNLQEARKELAKSSSSTKTKTQYSVDQILDKVCWCCWNKEYNLFFIIMIYYSKWLLTLMLNGDSMWTLIVL